MSLSSERLGQQALESYLWGAANLLRGLIDAGDYKQYVFPLLFFKRLADVWDEEYHNALDETGDEGYAQATADDRFIIPAGARWSDVRSVSRDVGRALRNAFRAIEICQTDAFFEHAIGTSAGSLSPRSPCGSSTWRMSNEISMSSAPSTPSDRVRTSDARTWYCW